MIKKLITGALLAAAALQASALDDPGRLYMLGDATPAGWKVWHPYALDWTARGVYVYEGGLTVGDLKFTNEVGNWGTAFAPAAGVNIGRAGLSASISGDGTDDRKWHVNEDGRYRITVDVRRETIRAEYLGPLPEAIYILGDAVDEWDATKGHPVYRRPDGKYVYQTWMFNEGGDGKAFKFTHSRGDWDKIEFYVPAEAGANGDIKYIGPGEYSMKSGWETSDDHNVIDAFWGVEHDNVMRVIVDLDGPAGPWFRIEKVYRSYGVDGSSDRVAAPLYWMGYEECYTSNVSLEEWRFDANVKWMGENFYDAGYEMICTDGWIEGAQTVTKNGYVNKYNSGWNKTLSQQADFCEEHGFLAGFYYDPLWMPRTAYDANCKIKGRDDKRTQDIKGDTNFNDFIYWVDTDKDGSEQWVKGFVRHIINSGFKFLRIDFLNLYENAYGTDRYQRALKWIKEEARDEIWVSIVMPNCYDHAWAEQRYGDMFRISEDVFKGGFDFVSQRRRGEWQNGWANWGNLFDGFLDFSDIDRSQVIMDGDFVRLNTCATDDERRFWLTLLVMAGSPVAIADQFDSPNIDHFKDLYRNERLISLVKEGFFAHPLIRDISKGEESLDLTSVWAGIAANGDHVVAFFNREDTRRQYFFDLFRIGENKYATGITDLWTGERLADCQGQIRVSLEPHQCRILRFKASDSHGPLAGQLAMLGVAGDAGTDSGNGLMLDCRPDGKYVWEGLLISHGNIWDDRQFNFTLGTGNWKEIDFLIPADGYSDGYRLNVKDGGVYRMRRVRGEGQPLGASWSIAAEDNGRYRIEVDPAAMTLRVTRLPLDVYALGAIPGAWDSSYPVALTASSADPDVKVLAANVTECNGEGKDVKFVLNPTGWEDAYFLIPAQHGTLLRPGVEMPALLRSRRFTRSYNNEDDYSASDEYKALDQQDNFWSLPSYATGQVQIEVNTRRNTVKLVGEATGVEDVTLADAGLRAWSRDGRVSVSAAGVLGTVSLYTLGGSLVARTVTDGSAATIDIPVAPGAYIVSAGCGSAKVIVR